MSFDARRQAGRGLPWTAYGLAVSVLFGCASPPETQERRATDRVSSSVATPRPPDAPRATPGSACLGLGPGMCTGTEGDQPAPGALNVLGDPLETCSTAPLTGWFRDGSCRTDARDRGVHVVCAEMTGAFLEFTRTQGNDLSTPREGSGFPGLRPGDRWCLCAARWDEARNAGFAPPVVLEASDDRALDLVALEHLKSAAHVANPMD